MLKGRGRDPRATAVPAHLARLQVQQTQAQPPRTPQPLRAPLAKPEPDYEVVEFPSDQYVNAKLQPPPPPPPRPPTGHPVEAVAPCGLCGGGGARVRCTECGRRALCASCDDMYHRHPKRRNHQRQALTSAQIREVRPPLPPKVAPPVPPPRRHKLAGDRASASPRPPTGEIQQQRRATIGHLSTLPSVQRTSQNHTNLINKHSVQNQQPPIPAHLQKLAQHAPSPQMGSMPYLPNVHQVAPQMAQQQMHQANTLAAWGRQRGSLQGFNVHPNMGMPAEAWESPESISPSGQTSPWGRPLRRGASVVDLGGTPAPPAYGGCAHCGPGWRYGSCASLDHSPWPGAWPPACCVPPTHHMHPHQHMHMPYTPQPHRRVESRTASRAGSRAGSRAASPAMSMRSRTSRRTKHRTPSPPSLPSSDADSESDSDDAPPPLERKDYRDQQRKEIRAQQEKLRKEENALRNKKEAKASQERKEAKAIQERIEAKAIQERKIVRSPTPQQHQQQQQNEIEEIRESSLGPAPPPPDATWQCEFCTFVNEPGVRVCVVCCRTPTAEPRVVSSPTSPPTTSPRVVSPTSPRVMSPQPTNRMTSPPPTEALQRLSLNEKSSPVRSVVGDSRVRQNGDTPRTRVVKEKTSTGCGPSPPRENNIKPISQLMSPARDQNDPELRNRHDMGVGPSPPRENRHNMATGPSPPRASPFRDLKVPPDPPIRHSVSVGPSPPRTTDHISVGAFPQRQVASVQRKSAGTSPPRSERSSGQSGPSGRHVANTGTSPPPQSISTQTYEVPNSWERERAPSVSRSRSRRRYRDEARRERSHSRHSLSSDTRESDRSARTSGGGGGADGRAGRWEWRETRDSSPPEWSGSERRPTRLARRASHLDLRRARSVRRTSYYGSEAASPERLSSNRALSMEALAGAGAAGVMSRREAERGLELARLMTDAERLGFSAAEVHAALAQNPVAPLAWLRERWPSLVAGVRAAAARLSPGASVTENEARAALARHRGAMWPAVTDCVDRHRRQVESMGVGEEGRLRGHVWGSPAGADDDAAPPPSARRPLRARADDSSDEYEAPIPTKQEDDDWMYLPLDTPHTYEAEPSVDVWNDQIPNIEPPKEIVDPRTEDIANKLKSFLIQAGVPSIDENLLLKGLLADSTVFKAFTENNAVKDIRPQSMDLSPFESDFIDAYNALTRSSPLPSINNPVRVIKNQANDVPLNDEAEARANTKENQIADMQVENALKKLNSGVDVTDSSSASQTKVEPPSFASVLNKHMNEKTAITSTNATVLLNEQIEEIVEEVTDNMKMENHTVAQVVLSSDKKQVAASQKLDNHLNQSAPTHLSEYSDTSSYNEGVEPAAPKCQKIQKNKTPSKSEPNLKVPRRKAPPRSERSTPDEERSSNLSDIVGSTQRLIQQMKEEITSDINSIDGHSMSQSEADNSSNESEFTSEQESSYSGTEETEDISSDENDESSTEEQEDVASQSGTALNRTSSEENEQFEEAMDHIEEQNESFKQTNIEILDSIARSLQEDHTISFELKQSLEAVIEAGQLNANAQEPEAFENVTAQLVQPVQSEAVTSPETPRSPSPVTCVIKKPQTAIPKSSVHMQPIHTAQASSSTLQVPKIVTPKHKKQDINNNLFVKVNSFDEIYDDLSSPSNSPVEVDKIKNKKSESTKNYIKVSGKKSPAKELPSPIVAESTTETVAALQRQEITNLTFKPDDPTRPTITDERRLSLNAKIVTIVAPETDNFEDKRLVENEKTQTVSINVNMTETNFSNHLQNTAESEESSENSVSEESSSEASRKTISPVKEVMHTTNKGINPGPNNDNKMDIDALAYANNKLPVATISNSQTVKAKSESPEKQTDNQTVKAKSKSPEKQSNIPVVKQKSLSPEKQTANIANDKSSNTNKSQIPKPVKVVPNAKQKVDKTGPKVIASKVPVRRGSLKQYPAPAPPPKFGNVQNGHVKQLQTRLFNSKFGNSKFGKMIANSMAASEPQPSTSTFNKKRPAPLPPSKTDAKPNPQEDTPTPPKERKPFFRETCRTEDEWTESDSDDAVVIERQDSSEPIRVPSPPPPITLRRVSGQLIDLATIRLLEGSPERQARMLLADGALESWEQAQLAVELVNRGTEPPAALLAALECADLDSALTYLHQDCELCASRLPEHEMVSMLRCTHRCCRECARLYFTVQITERSIADCVCPYCKEPELETLPEDAWLEYFAHLDILLKTLLDVELHELFQRKLRDRTLARDPNFRWCVECSSGFFMHPKHKKLRCPECKSVSCAKCRKPWTSNHEGLTCEQYATWLEDNDPERSAAAVQQHLRENGLECPRCRFKYSLSRGGCMHFTCTQCKYEFCYGCGKPFMMGARCGLSDYCNRLGLHAHHPRNCLFYLRDKEPRDLQTLLQMNNISFETQAPEGSTNRCPIQLQKETPTGLVDAACGSEVLPNHAGLCKPHYVEYLAGLARGSDPIPIMDVSELVAELRRRALPLPERGPWDTDPIYAGMCAEIVREKIPLE
ncbi:hypothetical protein O0L34_g1384 [Tuta absoluta]|nr:hypothetical protein O0L34_g1384 [Tuta absoluta]